MDAPVVAVLSKSHSSRDGCGYGVPVPLRGISWLAAPWRTRKNPVRVPVARGVKNTLTVQLLPGAKLVPQCGSLSKSRQFVPEVANPKGSRKLAATVPLLVSVTVCEALVVPTATLPKLSEAGESFKTMLRVPLPVPLSGSWCGVPVALSTMVTLLDFVPGDVGVKITHSVQEAPEPKLVGQLLLS